MMNLFDIIRARLIDGGGGGGADEEAIYQEILDTLYGSGSTPAPSNFRYVAIDTLSVSTNGVYTAPQNTAYSSVNVAVSGGGVDHTFDVPTVSGSFTYDGTSKTPTISGFYSDFMTESGDFSGTTAGTYSIVFTLKDTVNCQWRDGTTAAKTVTWSIAKAALPKPTLSAATLSLNSDNLTGTFTVTRVGDGVISATSADTSKVTASVSGNTVTVTLVDTTAVGSTVNVTVTVAEGTNYLAYSATDVVCEVSIVDVTPQGHIVFESEDGTNISVSMLKWWNGTLEYSTDGMTWTTWTGSAITALKVYLRGTENTRISSSERHFSLTGTNITCKGRIDNLLDYSSVMQGNTPQKQEACFAALFRGCTSLITPPEIPLDVVSNDCCAGMFYGCTSLSSIPRLPATLLVYQCYRNMFRNCSAIKISTVQSSEYPNEYRIPSAGTGSLEGADPLTDMFTGTGGSFTGTPTINTIYYTSNTVV